MRDGWSSKREEGRKGRAKRSFRLRVPDQRSKISSFPASAASKRQLSSPAASREELRSSWARLAQGHQRDQPRSKLATASLSFPSLQLSSSFPSSHRSYNSTELETQMYSPSNESLLVSANLPESLKQILVLLLGKVDSRLVVRNGVGVGNDDLSSVRSSSDQSSDHTGLRGDRSSGVVVEDGEERESLEGEEGRGSTGRKGRKIQLDEFEEEGSRAQRSELREQICSNKGRSILTSFLTPGERREWKTC